MAEVLSLLKAFGSSAADVLPLTACCSRQCQAGTCRCAGAGLVLQSLEVTSPGRLYLAFGTTLTSEDGCYGVNSAWLFLLTCSLRWVKPCPCTPNEDLTSGFRRAPGLFTKLLASIPSQASLPFGFGQARFLLGLAQACRIIIWQQAAWCCSVGTSCAVAGYTRPALGQSSSCCCGTVLAEVR